MTEEIQNSALLQKPGVYIILNCINNKCYIGSSMKVRRRIVDHKRLLLNNQHHSYKLQRAINKYGIKNFDFKCIEYVEFPEYYSKLIKCEYLECLEEFYINKYNSFINGYNVSQIPRIIGNHSAESIKKGIETRRKNGSYNFSQKRREIASLALRNSEALKKAASINGVRKRKLVYQYDLEGNFIREWSWVGEIVESLHISKGQILKNLTGVYFKCKDYIFSYNKYDKIDSYLVQRENKKRKPKKKYIHIYDLDNNLICILDSAKELYNKYHISNSYCSKSIKGNTPVYKKYILKYGEKH